MKINFIAACNGRCHWSNQPGRKVEIIKLDIGYLNEEKDFGELRAYFKPTTWDLKKFGLIYTDEGWLDEFRSQLKTYGFSQEAVDAISYSEQGMQDATYVSLDFEVAFYKEWINQKWDTTPFLE
jgi:hypothetical protein